MSAMTSSRIVLEFKREHFKAVEFECPREVGEEEIPEDSHTLPYEKWVEMDCPTVITVTVEPGDKLNEEE